MLKITPRDRVRIFEMFVAGRTLQFIGDRHGITREYVRRLCQDAGLEPRTKDIKRRKAARQLQAKQRKSERVLRVLFLNHAWEDGFSLTEFADIFGYLGATGAAAVASRISWCRARWGLFKYRSPDHWQLLDPNYNSQRRELVAGLSKIGVPASEIALLADYKNSATARAAIVQFQNRWLELFQTAA